MLDPLRLARVGEAVRYAPQQTYLAIGLAQQQRPALGRQPVTGKLRHHPPRKMSFKRESLLCTLCHGKGRPPRRINYASQTQLCTRERPFSTPNPCNLLNLGEKCGLARQGYVASYGTKW
jgi:hypothetical protein